MKKVIFTFKTYSLDDLDNVQIIIQIFSNSTFEKKKLCAKKNYTEWPDYVKDSVFSCEFWWNRCLNDSSHPKSRKCQEIRVIIGSMQFVYMKTRVWNFQHQ